MGRTRNLADLLDDNGDVKIASLDNVPPSDDASALTSGVLATARLPAGVVLQVQSTNSFIGSEQTISPGSYYNFPSVTITPKSSSSTIFVLTTPTFYTRSADGSYANTHAYIADSTNNLQYKMHEWLNYSDNATTHGLRLRYPFIYPFSNNVTTPREFRCRAYANHSTNPGRIGGENMHTIVAIEVAS